MSEIEDGERGRELQQMGINKMEKPDSFRRINEQKLFWFIRHGRMEEQISGLVETITMNIGYPISTQNLRILFDHDFYFDICAIIFPQLNIPIIKIGEHQSWAPALKMQKLLELLTQELQINLAALSGREILKGHSLHLYQFLNVLKQFSELPPSRSSLPLDPFRQRVYSCPSLQQLQKNTKQPQSARNQHKQRNLSISVSQQQIEPNKQILPGPEQQIQNEPKQAITQLKIEARKQDKIVQKQNKRRKMKNSKKIVKVSQSQNTLNKINKKYSCLLQKLMKTNKEKEQKSKQKKIVRSKTAQNRGDWRKEVKDIDDFFRSFELKIRDQKAKYLLKMQQIIRTQQNQRMRYIQRVNIQKTKDSQKHQTKQIQKLITTHSKKTKLLQERTQQNRQTMSTLKKQHAEHLRSSIRSLKMRKQKELKQIKNSIAESNNKILMKFQEGGELEKLVLNLYRRI